MAPTTTRSPGWNTSTSLPTSCTTPTASWPSVRLCRSPMPPWTVCESDVQIRALVVFTMASFGPGFGIGLSMKPVSPIFFITNAFIAAVPPRSSFPTLPTSSTLGYPAARLPQPERLGWREPGRAQRGVQAGQPADDDAQAHGGEQHGPRHNRVPVPGGRVHRRREPAGDRAGSAAEAGEHDRLGHELHGYVQPPRAESPPHPDLRLPLQHADHHHVRDADAADEQRDAAQGEEQTPERGGRVCPGDERVGGVSDRDVLRGGGIGDVRQVRRDGRHAGWTGPHIDL